MKFVKMAVLDTSVWILHQKSISAEFLLWVALHIRYFFALGRVGAAVVLVVEKALPAWVGGWLWGVTHSDNGGLHSWERVHAALTRYFMLHGSQLKLVVVRHPHKRAPAENPFKAGPKPEPRINTKHELKLIYEQKHNLHIYVCVTTKKKKTTNYHLTVWF